VREVSWYDAVKWCNALSEREGLVPVYSVNGTTYRSGNFGLSGSSVIQISRSANGYRLPTEAEWEWAARGGVNSQGYSYSGANNPSAVGWNFDNSSGAPLNLRDGRGTWPVGLKIPNELGIYDMTGNVFEWCENLVEGSDSLEVWALSESGKLAPVGRFYDLGFRLARNVELSSIVWDWNNSLQGWDINEYDSGNIVQLENGQEGMGIALNSYQMVNYNVPRWFKVGDVLNNGFIEVDMKHVVPSVFAVYIDVYIYGGDGWGRFIYYPYDGYTSKSENLGSGWMRYRLVPSPGFDKVHEYNFMTPKPDSPRVTFSYNNGSFPLEIDNFVLQD
jgi:hypothetical protein